MRRVLLLLVLVGCDRGRAPRHDAALHRNTGKSDVTPCYEPQASDAGAGFAMESEPGKRMEGSDAQIIRRPCADAGVR